MLDTINGTLRRKKYLTEAQLEELAPQFFESEDEFDDSDADNDENCLTDNDLEECDIQDLAIELEDDGFILENELTDTNGEIVKNNDIEKNTEINNTESEIHNKAGPSNIQSVADNNTKKRLSQIMWKKKI
ncbi:hypothetical protein FQA39_LY17491 [Lamprigera yunnana]|nr:hypothetical protein FQA39_LY17491 [Lamprigera yunnana]